MNIVLMARDIRGRDISQVSSTFTFSYLRSLDQPTRKEMAAYGKDQASGKLFKDPKGW